MVKISKLEIAPHEFIAYHKHKGKKKNQPGIIFLGGFMSDMEGDKAKALEKLCVKNGYGFIRFDYFGHGKSSGEFAEGNIGKWKDNALAVLDNLTEGPQILIGSSMGGWLMCLVALERPDRIVGLIGVASAPDFTEDLIWEEMDDVAKTEIIEKGVHYLHSDYYDKPYPITKQLIEDGRKHLILDKKININVPVRLLHGMQDKDVPPDYSIRLSEQITSDNMCVNLVPFGDHRMSTPVNLNLLCEIVEEMVAKYQ